MTAKSEPHYASGKICYVEIPATDIRRSADFYGRVFGWSVRAHEDGSLAFDDTVGQVSGMWVTGRKPIGEAGLIVSIMVADAATCCDAIVAAGGEITQPIDPNASEITAWFLDPAGICLASISRAVSPKSLPKKRGRRPNTAGTCEGWRPSRWKDF